MNRLKDNNKKYMQHLLLAVYLCSSLENQNFYILFCIFSFLIVEMVKKNQT